MRYLLALFLGATFIIRKMPFCVNVLLPLIIAKLVLILVRRNYWCAARTFTALLRLILPPPHFLLHDDHLPQPPTLHWIGHGCVSGQTSSASASGKPSRPVLVTRNIETVPTADASCLGWSEGQTECLRRDLSDASHMKYE